MELVEADLVAHLTTLFGPPFGEVVRLDDAVLLLTRDPEPHRNGVLSAALDVGNEGRIDELMQPFRDRGVGMMWWVFAGRDGIDRRLHQGFLKRG
ncbi:MAG TPA: hypothetical protein VFK89_07595, partial [Actinomycetota bacterium]|nr:hypothetical protein [Actinomycetota bacterium]